jgi:hypothetical protein
VLREVAFWDVYYEHCSYFTPGSLTRLFRQTGFDVLDLALDYDDQYILIEARPGSGTVTPALDLEEQAATVVEEARRFSRAFAETKAGWRERVSQARAEGRKPVIWGAGSKGVSFLTTLGIDDDIEYAVDVNPFKHGKFMAGTGQEIVSPESLAEYQPGLVIAMNPIYLDEIGAQLSSLGVSADLVAV